MFNKKKPVDRTPEPEDQAADSSEAPEREPEPQAEPERRSYEGEPHFSADGYIPGQAGKAAPARATEPSP